MNLRRIIFACAIALLVFVRVTEGQPANFGMNAGVARSMTDGIVYARPAGILHQYPLTGSRENPPETNIGIRAGHPYDKNALANATFIAYGSISGAHRMTVRLSRDRSVAIFHSVTPFAYNETISFAMSARLVDGSAISDTVRFATMVQPVPTTISDWIVSEDNGNASMQSAKKGMLHPLDGSNDSFPFLVVTTDDSATPGTMYFDNFGFNTLTNSCYLFAANEHGAITRNEELPGESSRDFKPQPNGMFTYYDIDAGAYLGMDSQWNVVDTFGAIGMGTDMHEVRVFPDTGYALLGLAFSNGDMTQYGGLDPAIIIGDVIQIFDPDQNLIFQWRGIDHYDIGDSKYEDLTASEIDFEHANSLDFDFNGDILLSNRHLCEISEINDTTGDFIWRFGGAHNQFKILGDSLVFSFQHDARWLPNGNMTIFDNSNYDTAIGGNGAWVQQSRACEYALDTTAWTATLVWQYHHSPETFSSSCGSTERLPSGNTLIGWGQNDSLAITEVRPDNSTAFEMQMLGGNISYRAFKDAPFGIIGIKDTSEYVSIASNPAGNNFAIQSLGDGSFAAVLSLASAEPVSLTLYDMTGREVLLLASQWESAGMHQIPLSVNGFPSGAYECVLAGNGFSESRLIYNLKQ